MLGRIGVLIAFEVTGPFFSLVDYQFAKPRLNLTNADSLHRLMHSSFLAAIPLAAFRE